MNSLIIKVTSGGWAVPSSEKFHYVWFGAIYIIYQLFGKMNFLGDYILTPPPLFLLEIVLYLLAFYCPPPKKKIIIIPIFTRPPTSFFTHVIYVQPLRSELKSLQGWNWIGCGFFLLPGTFFVYKHLQPIAIGHVL